MLRLQSTAEVQLQRLHEIHADLVIEYPIQTKMHEVRMREYLARDEDNAIRLARLRMHSEF